MNDPTTDLADKILTCTDCKTEFLFTAGEQRFFAEKGFTEPRRCKPCREARKQEKLRAAVADPRGGGQSPYSGVWADEDRGNRWEHNEGRRYDDDRPRRKRGRRG